MNETEGGLLC